MTVFGRLHMLSLGGAEWLNPKPLGPARHVVLPPPDPRDTWGALCRCRASANKPCRDGSHRWIDFRAVREEVEAL